MAVQQDGKILLAAGSSHLYRTTGAMARLNPDGSFDTSFGSGGGLIDFRTGLPFGPLVVQSSGQIVAATGTSASPANGPGFVFTAFAANGSPSADFGSEGIAVGPPVEPGWSAGPAALVLRPDGRLAVGGTVSSSSKSAFISRAVAQIFNGDGSFGEPVGSIGQGVPERAKNPELSDLAQRADGSLMAIGATQRRSAPSEVFAARFVPGLGLPFDPSFASGEGVALFDPYPSAPSPVANAAVATGDRSVIVGSVLHRPMLMRLDPQGGLDPTFGDGGIAVLPMEATQYADARAVAVQPDGKLLIAGTSLGPCQADVARGCWSLLLGRVSEDGTLDASFGNGGFTQLPFPAESVTEAQEIDVMIAAGGRIFVAVTENGGENTPLYVAGFEAGGRLDAGFGNGGIARPEWCTGTVGQLRQSGCFSTARVRLRVKGLRGRQRAKLDLSVRATQPLDPLSRVRLEFPRALVAKAWNVSRRIQVSGNGTLPVQASRRAIAIRTDENPDTISLRMPRGLLQRTERIARGRKLRFRVQVWFRDGSKQRIVLRRTG